MHLPGQSEERRRLFRRIRCCCSVLYGLQPLMLTLFFCFLKGLHAPTTLAEAGGASVGLEGSLGNMTPSHFKRLKLEQKALYFPIGTDVHF